MATQFVKWWKTKFQSRTHHSLPCAGYSTMSVLSSDGSDGRASDTEDLLRDESSSCHNGAHVNDALTSTASSDNSSISSNEIIGNEQCTSHPVKFEDFECDVQVEGSESGEERKEFSFTFYDLDGHGKITKDDIAGLVRSIYGAVNDSITVPQGGKKTIKVRLTVTPEQQKVADEHLATQNLANNNNTILNGDLEVKGQMGCGISANSNTESNNTPERSTKLRNNVNVTIRENLNRHGGSVRHRERHADKPRFNSVRLPNGGDCRGCRNLLPEVLRDCGASPMRHRKKWRERHCRPDLCDLIQANMEKNNVHHCCRTAETPAGKGPPCAPPSPLCTHNHLLDPNCPILPLLNNDKFPCSRSVKFSDNVPGAKFFRHSCRRHGGHSRSRSHDLSDNPFKYQLIGESEGPCVNHQCSHEESLEILSCVQNAGTQAPPSPRNKNTNNNNKNILNKLTQHPATTQHQLKHRNREEDHARAMAQVINWLERENIGDKINAKPCFNFQQEASRLPAKKQEHHHVHEHIHHHYHHHFSKETPIIV